ncbi:MAG: hypothetical protein ACQESC_02570 [Nanobdellota archaeon]
MKKISSLLRHILQSLNLNKYNHISEKFLSHSIGLFFKVVIVGMVLLSLLLIPKVAMLKDNIQADIDQFSQAELSMDVSVTEPLILLDYPSIVLDPSVNANTSTSFLTIGDNYTYHRKQILFGEQEQGLPTTIDIKENKEEVSSLLNVLALLFLPGFIIIILILLILLSFILVLLSALIGFWLKKSKHFTFRDSVVIAIHAILVPFILTCVLIPLTPYYWTPIGLFLILFILGVAVTKGKDLLSSSKPSSSRSRKKKSRSSKK